MHDLNRNLLSDIPCSCQFSPPKDSNRFLDRLGRDGRVLATALAEAFSTSEDTIRRDLRDLAGRGLCRRVYGGALPVSPASRSAQVRAGESTERKAALGQALAGLVAPGSLVFVDSGSDESRGGEGFSR